jgi:hypothetical protein
MNYWFYSILFKLKTYLTYLFNNVFDKTLLFVELSVIIQQSFLIGSENSLNLDNYSGITTH